MVLAERPREERSGAQSPRLEFRRAYIGSQSAEFGEQRVHFLDRILGLHGNNARIKRRAAVLANAGKCWESIA
jgi:hypothetical protein